MAWHRTSRQARGYGADWMKLREQILERDLRLCQSCLRKDRIQPANEVHHVRPRSQCRTQVEADDPSNLVSLCHACHLEADAAAQGRRLIKRCRVALDGTLIDG